MMGADVEAAGSEPALSAAEPVAKLQSVDAKELEKAIRLLPSVMRQSLSNVIIAAIEEQRRIIDYFNRTSRARQLAFEAATAPPAPSVAVKALEWDADENHSVLQRADFYTIESEFRQGFALHTAGTMGVQWFSTEAEAKAAAQADYEARIRSALSAQVQDVAESPAIKAIAAERARQIEKEGWSPAHDDKYTNGELLEAAACYALHGGGELDDAPGAWPWSRDFWKPTTRQRDLEKAGALIAAELDRVIRSAAPAKQEG